MNVGRLAEKKAAVSAALRQTFRRDCAEHHRPPKGDPKKGDPKKCLLVLLESDLKVTFEWSVGRVTLFRIPLWGTVRKGTKLQAAPNMSLLCLQSPEGKFTMSREIETVRRSCCRCRSRTFTEVARFVPSGTT